MNTSARIRHTALHGRWHSVLALVVLVMLTLALAGCADDPSDERPSGGELTSKVTTYSATKTGPCGLTRGVSPFVAEQSCLSRVEGYPTPNWNAGLLELRARCGSEPTAVLNTFTYYWAPSVWARFDSCGGLKKGGGHTYSVPAHMQKNGKWTIIGQPVVCESLLAMSCSPL